VALLAWIKSQKVFLKIQEGTGDNLSAEDVADGMTDYVLWSVFRPADLDLDETLDMQLVDSGMLMFKVLTMARESLPECYVAAFDRPYDETDVNLLLNRTF
jgi:hypothetical protein